MPPAEFLVLARARHGNWYRYDMRQYRGSSVPISILCPKHGPFRCYPHNHVGRGGQECRKCRRERRALGITRGCVYFLHGVDARVRSLVNIGHTEDPDARFPSHESSDQVQYTFRWTVPSLTYRQQIDLEICLLAEFKKLWKPVRRRREVFVAPFDLAFDTFNGVVRRWRRASAA
jgi:predicted GIY-YIG superfamily endonuclease